MSELHVDYENSVCRNAQVYGFYESVKASKYPFATDIDNCSDSITGTTKILAGSPKGSGEDTFMNGIIVQMDLTLSEKAWPEFQRYHFADFVSSQSTMHCITKFDIAKQCNENVSQRVIDVLKCYVECYEAAKEQGDKEETEKWFYKIIYNIPSGFRLTARVTTNYRQLKTMYAQRKNHRLKPDWGEFCTWIEHLPESWMITGKEEL